MPLFDIECDACGEINEDVLCVQNGSSIKYPYCKECGYTLSEGHRLVGKASFKLKGKGWAKDNYSNK